MISLHVLWHSKTLKRCPPTLLAVGIGLVVMLTAERQMGATQPGDSDQCVACHTDASKLKALTPPDSPLSEEGEG